jgi:hypothetical protein
MTELELQLTRLAAELDWPPAPDVAAAVRARLPEDRPRRRRPGRRALVVALVVVVVGVGAAFAVPSARTTILRWLGLRGVRIELVDRLPAVSVTQRLGLGSRVTLAEARRRAGYRLVTLPAAGAPNAVYFRSSPPGGEASFLYGTPSHLRLLVSQFVGVAEPQLVKKIATGDTRIEFLRIGGGPAIWLSGAPHFFLYSDADRQVRQEARLAGNTLLWQRGRLTLRLEGALSKQDAVRLAGSARSS